MLRTRVKICGTTTVGDALLAAEAGADAVGLIFAPGSKRLISAVQAREISLALGPAVGRVGVFLGQEIDEVLRLAEAARVSAVQLHGPLSSLELSQVAGYYPVLRVLRPQDLAQAAHLAWPPHVTPMLDAPQPGSGQSLDWAGLAPQVPAGIWLAGGLGPLNVGQAMRALRPAGVDAVSALELRPGIKDPDALRAFVAAVRRADAELA
ncbi:N-(5'-phosphoribosyl)anthranilate isomerase [Deinococcus irradiatisoli]|uniref:N-(5'-phosphoribosyl)anthranilate isomerase n=1 Tax=Deinococcus irradiatisoli TaxID=2202254 RepID=A0A2Z3JGQ8_9DEIO|nr:N-(5'-phosphoribosyl)anthranilate isomerase [Deinococcus irradiatisoli]AWN24347.1 N-(5'-phosphoribosyl)anthranilate isomerase [Deinococcus irradiatisoli]